MAPNNTRSNTASIDRQVTTKIGPSYSAVYISNMLRGHRKHTKYSEERVVQAASEIGVARTPVQLGISKENGNSNKAYIRSANLQAVLDKLEIGISAKKLVRGTYRRRVQMRKAT